MITPLAWLERVPTYKDQQEQLSGQGSRDLRLPRLPAAAERGHPHLHAPPSVPVGEDQVAHVELTREIARRFNFIYRAREAGFEEKAEAAIQQPRRDARELYRQLRRKFMEQGDAEGARRQRGAGGRAGSRT